MLLKDLLQVTTDFSMYMYNKNTNESIILDRELLKELKIIGKLKVKDIYSDCGLQVEIKFDKECYKTIKNYQKSLDK